MDLETWKIIKDHIRPTEPHLRVLLPRHHAGCIMGHKGSVVQRLKKDYKIFIEIIQVPGAKWGRVITVKGEHTAQSKVWHEIFNITLRNTSFAVQLYTDYGYHYNFILPTDLVDLLTYEGDFQRIANESGIQILVKHKHLMRSTERIVSFQMRDEKLEGFEKAVLLLAECVGANPRFALCAPDNVFYREQCEDDIWQYMHYYRDGDVVYSPLWTQFVQNKPSNSDPLPPRKDSVSSRRTGSVTSDHIPQTSNSNTTNQSSEQYVTPAMTRSNSAKEEDHVAENSVEEKELEEEQVKRNNSPLTGQIKKLNEDLHQEQEQNDKVDKCTVNEDVDNQNKNNTMKEMAQSRENESTELDLEEVDDENDKFRDNEDDDDNKEDINLIEETTHSESTERDLEEERFHDAEEDIEE